MSLRKLIAAAALLAAHTASPALELLVPAYFYPSSNPSLSYWDELTAAAVTGVKVTAIINPNNGVGASQNSDYVAAVDAFRVAGGKVLGYAYTCYGGALCSPGLPTTKTTADVVAEAAKYANWYGVDGLFLDEMSNQLSDLPYYTTLAAQLRTAHPAWKLVGNPGTSTPVDYLATADTLVTFERGSASYAGAATQPWMTTADPSRQAHLHYNVSTAAQMQTLLNEAVSRRAGYIYITDDRYLPGDPTATNPWDTLPSYWAEEVAAVNAANAVSAVPEPSAYVLMMLGGALVWARSQKFAKRC
jgi:Spherulation-specific family 4